MGLQTSEKLQMQIATDSLLRDFQTLKPFFEMAHNMVKTKLHDIVGSSRQKGDENNLLFTEMASWKILFRTDEGNHLEFGR